MPLTHSKQSWLTRIQHSLAETRHAFFPYHEKFVFRGKTYLIRRSGQRLVDLLRDWQAVNRDENRSALDLRAQIEEVVLYPAPTLLCYLLHHCSNAKTIRMLLLIVRRTRSHAATRLVLGKFEHSDARVRHDVVRTLERLGAWRELRIVRERCDYADARELADSHQRPSFETRLENFARVARSYPHAEHHQELVVSPEVDWSEEHPPRSGSQIARVLHTIRRLFRRARRRRRWRFIP